MAIVGGGYTGLCTALALRRSGADVVLLDQDFAGSGASGRNAGHLTPTIGKDLPFLLRRFGRRRAADLVHFAETAVLHTEEQIRKLGIECDYAASGNVLAAVHRGQEARLRRAARVAREIGARVAFLGPAGMRERGIPAGFPCGVLEEVGGTLHPGRYVQGLRRAALAAGVRLFEGTRVERLEPGAPVTLHAPDGEVRADHAVIATNAYPAPLAWLRRRVAPARVSLFETAPLPADLREQLAWSGGAGIYTAHEMLESYRLTPRGSIVGGAKRIRIGFGAGLPAERDARILRGITAAFRQRFPALAPVPIARTWGGWIGFSSDFLPLVGSAGNLHWGGAYAGHGVAQATLMGELLASRVQGGRHPLERALGRLLLPWPPEPLRWPLGQALLHVLAAVDAITDRRARRGSARARTPDRRVP